MNGLARLPRRGTPERDVLDQRSIRLHAGAMKRRHEQGALASVRCAIQHQDRTLTGQRCQKRDAVTGKDLRWGGENLLDTLRSPGQHNRTSKQFERKRIAIATGICVKGANGVTGKRQSLQRGRSRAQGEVGHAVISLPAQGMVQSPLHGNVVPGIIRP